MRYIVFSGTIGSPKGGADDIALATDSAEEAISLISNTTKWHQILDTHTMVVIVRSSTPHEGGNLMSYTPGPIAMGQSV